MYPEKAILDVAGFPTVKGRDLVAGLVEQAATADPAYFLERTALTLEHGEESVTVGLDDGTRIDRPRRCWSRPGSASSARDRCPVGDDWLGRGMEFFVPSFEPYVDKDVVIVGGGDSAFDWALHLEPVAASVTLVHRRDAFRAHQRTVDAVRASSVRRRDEGPGDPAGRRRASWRRWRSPSTARSRSSVPPRRWWPPSASSPTWGRCRPGAWTTEKRHVVVDSAMRTNLPRVFAAGDITEYPGKVRLIAVGFGEAATAVNNAAVVIDPTAHVFPGHSSEGG